jgi:ubiquitin C-terminal hydrolase
VYSHVFILLTKLYILLSYFCPNQSTFEEKRDQHVSLLVHQLCMGLEEQRTCTNCHKQGTTFAESNCLQVRLINGNDGAQLKDLLETALFPPVDDSMEWGHPDDTPCGEKLCRQTMKICSIPHVLCIQLLPFDGVSDRKLQLHVDIPPILDMTNFTTEEARGGRKRVLFKVLVVD